MAQSIVHCTLEGEILYSTPVFHHLSANPVFPSIIGSRPRQFGRTPPGRLAAAVGLAAAAMILSGCTGGSADRAQKRNNLDSMEKANISIGNTPFEVWLALDDAQRELGLMQVPAEQLAAIPNPAGQNAPPIQRGMLFVFEQEMPLSFWMANTITALDIAYIAPDGTIVRTYTMAPLETRIYPSIEPAQYALEVRAGLFAELGISSGMHVEIPESVLKGVR